MTRFSATARERIWGVKLSDDRWLAVLVLLIVLFVFGLLNPSRKRGVMSAS
jgi:hypothetical protein